MQIPYRRKICLGVARFFRRHFEDVKGTTETQKAFSQEDSAEQISTGTPSIYV